MSVPDSPESGPGRGALTGVRVIEIGQMIAGPFCGHLFADHGAEVIKIEPPGEGDVMRRWGGLYRGVGLYWPLISREKKSVTLDLRHEAGRRVLRSLLQGADVLIENFRPGTLERWGLAPENLWQQNAGLVVVRASGYGQSGPYREKAGFGAIGEAMSGFRYLTAEPGHPPVRPGISLGDALAATHGFTGALMALYQRDRPGGSGRGQVVDIAIYEAMWAYMEGLLPEYEKLGRVRQPSGSILPGIAPSNVYPTSDGQWLVIGANTDSVFRRFAAALGHPEWAEPSCPFSTHVGRGTHQADLDGRISDWTADHGSDEILALLDAAGVPAGRLYTAAEIAVDPQFQAREMIVAVEEPGLDGEEVRVQGVVPHLSETPGRVRRGGPLLGEHNREVLLPLLGEEEFVSLGQKGVI